jgi:hypothetical protein
LKITSNNLLVLGDDDQVIVLRDNTGNAFRVSLDLQQIEKRYSSSESIISTSATLSGISYFAELTPADEEVKVTVFETSSNGNKNVNEFTFVRPKIQHGLLKRAYLHAFKNEDTSLGFRVLVVSEDDSVTVAKKDKEIWTREEGLASIESSYFVNLPRKISDKRSATENTYIRRISAQVAQLKSIVPGLQQFVQGLVSEVRGLPIYKPEDSLYEDHFGFQKLVIVKSKAGKLYGLHTNSGKIVWSTFVKVLITERDTLRDAVSKMYVIRQQEAGEEDTSVVPEIAVLMKKAEESTVSTIVRLNGLDGTVIKAEELSFSFKSAILLPITESKTLYHPLLIIDAEMNVHVFPDKQRMRATLMKFPQQIYFYTVDETSGIITGYSWSPKAVKATAVWSTKYEGNIVSVTANTSPQNENIYSSVHIYGKTVQSKYLNPNLFVVATTVESEGETDLHLYLVDSVTGHQVYHVIIENAQGPVSTIVDDNAVLCQYMNMKPKRPQITSFELFVNDTSSHGESFVHSIAKRFIAHKQQTVSSYELPRPIVLQHTFILPYPTRTIASTKTSIGVTSKEFLLALTNGQILELNKKMVDVRRPRGKTPVSDEEGILPYNPYIPYNPPAMLTYNNTVHNVRGIQTDPSLLESTTHVVAYGLDLFYRRITPSKPFDSLSHDFSHLLLLLTIVALIVLTFVSRAYASKKALSQAWSS